MLHDDIMVATDSAGLRPISVSFLGVFLTGEVLQYPVFRPGHTETSMPDKMD